jgi:hypothetical protein
MVEGYYPAGLGRLCAQQTEARAKFASSYEDVMERKGLMRRTTATLPLVVGLSLSACFEEPKLQADTEANFDTS